MTAQPDRRHDPETQDLQHDAKARTAQDADQSAADLDQSQSDSDQASSDTDQTASDADQALAHRDQHASDRDQAAADWESAHPGGGASATRAHETSRLERQAASRERDATEDSRSGTAAQRLIAATQRDEVARIRDLVAAVRDRTAQARDEAAAARDRVADARERRAIEAGAPVEVFAPLREIRALGAAIRESSRLERIAAAEDRGAAAADRRRGATDRGGADMEDLTGVFRRDPGELALTHELERSRRGGRSLILAVIDVEPPARATRGPGPVDDDARLREVATSITATLRSYDVTVRWGAAEFVCALADVTRESASESIAEIERLLGRLRPGVAIAAGLAEMHPGDTLESLIARADADLDRARIARSA
jgi:diguanylate cyclase (GGDEF)-like protein